MPITKPPIKANYPNEHLTWRSIQQRCNNKKDPYYGGKGIKMCERWVNGFEFFLTDMGAKPNPKFSIDRINADGNYELSNCRWVTSIEQRRNIQSTNNYITYKGETKTLGDWADGMGISSVNVYQRIFKYGWSVHKALTTGLRKRLFTKKQVLKIRSLNGVLSWQKIGDMYGVSATEIGFIQKRKHYSDIK